MTQRLRRLLPRTHTQKSVACCLSWQLPLISSSSFCCFLLHTTAAELMVNHKMLLGRAEERLDMEGSYLPADLFYLDSSTGKTFVPQLEDFLTKYI